MVVFFWAVLLTTGFIFLENLFLVLVEGHGFHGGKTIAKIIKGKFNNWNSADTAIISGILLLIAAMIFSPQIYQAFLVDQSIDLPESTYEAPEPRFIAKTEVQYENEVFGSTVNKFIVEKQFTAEDIFWATPSVKIRKDPESVMSKVVYIPSVDGVREIAMIPKHQYNQFAGKYRALFSIKGVASQRDVPLMQIDIVDSNNGAILSKKEIYEKDTTDMFIPFALDYEIAETGAAPEIRITTTGQAPITIENFSISALNGTMAREFTVEDTFPDVPDPHASQGSARYADPADHLPGTMLFGPYDTTLKGGQYMAEFRIKTDATKLVQPLVRIQTANLIPNTNQQYIETMEVKGIDFEQAGRYQTFTLPANVTDDGFFEIRAYFYDVAPIWIDSVRLYNTSKKGYTKS